MPRYFARGVPKHRGRKVPWDVDLEKDLRSRRQLYASEGPMLPTMQPTPGNSRLGLAVRTPTPIAALTLPLRHDRQWQKRSKEQT